MLSLTNFYFIRKILQKQFHWKKFSTELKNVVEDFGENSALLKKMIDNLLTPCLGLGKLKEVSQITGLSIKINHLSWATISVPSLKIIDWNFQSKPEDFKNKDEASILKLAWSLKQRIPVSDLYVMEKIGSREASKNLNDIRLSSMLMVILNNLRNSMQENEKVVFQKENVINILCGLSIGNERISSRQVFETMLYEVNESEKLNTSKNDFSIFYSLTKSDLENLKLYDNSSLVEQESLSFVLLLTMSFIDVFIHHNVQSLRKIQMLTKFKKIQR